MTHVVEIRNLTFYYPSSPSEGSSQAVAAALKKLNLQVQSGEFVAVIGHNGSGKSTLAKQLNGLLLPTEGQAIVCGYDTSNSAHLWEIRRRVGMVFQNPDNQIVATTVEEDVAFGLENMGVPRDEMIQRVDEALEKVKMVAYRYEEPHRLSGGQKQRVAIAGILAMKPELIVFDEATTMLDPQGREEVLTAVHRLNREEGITVVHMTHFLEEAVQADRVVVMNEGQVTMQGRPVEVFSQRQVLLEIGLELPFAAEMAHRLRTKGFPIPANVLTSEQLVEAIVSILNSQLQCAKP